MSGFYGGITTATITNSGLKIPSLFFGDGSDGNVTVSTSISLSRDTYYNNLTLVAGGSINTVGWRIFVKNTLDITSADANAIKTPINSGGNATIGTGGTAATQQAIRSWMSSTTPVAGVNGTVGVGNNGNTNVASGGFCGGSSGVAGAGGTGSGGAGGSAGVRNLAAQFTSMPLPFLLPIGQSGSGQRGGVDSPSGGSGGGDGTSGGGSGGGAAGGGMVAIFAYNINRSSSNANVGVISAIGGNGGNGAAPTGGNRGGGGGAGGGGGGNIYIVHAGLLGTTHANALDVSGGNGGNGGAGTGTGTAGAGGQGGSGGRVAVINIAAETNTLFDGTGSAGTTATGVTGGPGATARTNL